MHLLHGFNSGLIGMVFMQASDPSAVGTVIKAVAALIIGLLGTLLSKWLEKKFPSTK